MLAVEGAKGHAQRVACPASARVAVSDVKSSGALRCPGLRFSQRSPTLTGESGCNPGRPIGLVPNTIPPPVVETKPGEPRRIYSPLTMAPLEFVLLLKLGLLFFWTAWLAIVFITNLCSGLKALGLLPKTWKFASQNFRAVASAVSGFHAPSWVPGFLFTGVIVWQLAATLLFGWALASSVKVGSLVWAPTHAAFAIALALWAAFMVADEICKQYDTESSHASFFTAQLLTLVCLHVLPS